MIDSYSIKYFYLCKDVFQQTLYCTKADLSLLNTFKFTLRESLLEIKEGFLQLHITLVFNACYQENTKTL